MLERYLAVVSRSFFIWENELTKFHGGMKTSEYECGKEDISSQERCLLFGWCPKLSHAPSHCLGNKYAITIVTNVKEKGSSCWQMPDK